MAVNQLVRWSYLEGREGFPRLCEPEVAGLRAQEWGASERGRIEAELEQHGAVLFRGFGIAGVEEFEAMARAITPELLDYRERAAPRFEVGKNIYTSTEYPADQAIPLHHEMSYSHNWPLKLWFYCQQPAAQGGATPIASDRIVFKRLNPQIKEQFLQKGVMYVRNYGDGIGLSWREAFQTSNRSEVENYCRQASIEFEWKDGDRLRTRQIFRAIVAHPRTKELVWFEHTAFFHISNLEPDVRETLTKEFAEADLPFNTYYGDGSTIEESVLDEVRAAYRRTACTFSWQKGDVLLIDNMLVSHARESFVPPRKVLVAMADLIGARIAHSFAV
jgi:alpha-ketoglutarate-dependent taurine dioxygenase